MTDTVEDNVTDEDPNPSEPDASPEPASPARWRRFHPAAYVVTALTTAWIVLFGELAVRHHRNFGTWSFDLGIYDQGYWLVSQFKPTFVTVRGLDFWGQHVNLVAYLYAPAYWLGAGPRFLVVSQAIFVGLGAWPVYLIARDRLSPWYGAMFAAAFLTYPAVEFVTWANYHPEALVITPFLFAWSAFTRRKVRLYIAMIIAVLLTREDAALAVTMLGAVMMYRQRRVFHLRRKGRPERDDDPLTLAIDQQPDHDEAVTARRNRVFSWLPEATLLAGIVWYVLSTRLFLPHFNNGEQPFYVNYFYQSWGGSMDQVVVNVARHPNRVVSDAIKIDRVRFYRDLLLPLGGFALLAPAALLIAGPQMLAAIIGGSPYARMILYQYTVMMIAPIFIASIEGFRRVVHSRRAWAGRAAFWLLACGVVCNIAWSPSPIGGRYGLWNGANNRVASFDKAVSLVPDDASLTATYSLLPHLSHRTKVYDWPNPWHQVSWGNHNENIPDPATVQYLVLDLQAVNASDQELVASLIGPDGPYQTVMNQDSVLVARRR